MKITPTQSSSSNDQSSRPSLHHRTESGLKLTKGETRRRTKSSDKDASDQDASKSDSDSDYVYEEPEYGELDFVEEPGQIDDNNPNTGINTGTQAQSSSIASGRQYHTRSKSGSSQFQAQSAAEGSTHGYNTRTQLTTSAAASGTK